MLRLLLITAIVLGALFMAGKFWFHQRVAEAVDAAIVPLQAAADVSYSGVTSSLTGEVGIENLHIKPHGLADSVQIESITAKFPDIGYVLKLEDNMQAQNYPDSLFLTVGNMSLSTNGALVRSLDENILAQMAAANITDNCVNRASNMLSELAPLGYEQLSVDYTVGYAHNSATGELSMSGSIRQSRAFEVDYEVVIPLAALSSAGAALFMTDPELINASFNLKDEGYYDKLLAHCSAIEGKDPAVVTQEILSAWIQQMSTMGVPPDQQMLADYHQFLTSGETFSLNAAPREPVKFQYLSLYEPKDIPNLLNIATAAN